MNDNFCNLNELYEYLNENYIFDNLQKYLPIIEKYNGIDYINFRGIASSNNYAQPKHSFYFYFGALPGKTSLDKMNQRYFTTCKVLTRNDMLLETSETPDLTSTSSGIITFTVIGGHGPYTYTINSSNGYSNSGTVNSDPLNIDNSLPVQVL